MTLDDQLAETAAGWRVRIDAGLTPAEEREFTAWLQEPANATMYEEISATWDLPAKAKPQIRARLAAPAPARGRKFVGFPTLLAAAAALGIAYIGWWRPNNYQAETATVVGEIREWKLPDGSVVSLNTDTVVSVAYSFHDRRIDLVSGEAHFTVAKDAERPFTVSAGKVSVQAIGTAFNVRRRADSVDVLVTEGVVAVGQGMATEAGDRIPESGSPRPVSATAKPSPTQLVAGERASFALLASVPPTERGEPAMHAAVVEAVSAPAIEQTLAWQKRRVEFIDATVADIVAEFNRHNRHKLLIDDPRLAAMRFGGTFPADAPESFVQLLEKTFGVIPTTRTESTLLRLAQ